MPHARQPTRRDPVTGPEPAGQALTQRSESEGLIRAMGVIGAALIVFNSMIGAGIYALPSALHGLGPWGPWMFVAMGLAMCCVVLAFARLASYYTATGGPVLYTADAFGPFVSFQTGWLLYLGRLTAMAANTNLLVDYVGAVAPGLTQTGPRIMVMLAVCGLLAWSNLSGVRQGMAALTVLTVLKLLPLALLVLLGLRFVTPTDLIPTSVLPTAEVGDTALLLVYALVGFEGALVTAGETRNPTRSIPRAIVPTVIGVAVFYALIQLVYIGLGPAVDPTSSSPLVDAAGVIFGGPGILIMTGAAVFSIGGNLSAIMVAAPRMTFAMAREGSLPRWFAHVSRGSHVPDRSIVFLAAVAFLLAASGSFRVLATMSSLSRMIAYAVSILALPVIRRSRGEKWLRARDGYVGVALVLCIWVAAQSTARGWVTLGAFMAIGSALFLVGRSSPARKA